MSQLSPKSKVQSPKSETKGSEASKVLERANAGTQDAEADVGRWTLDVGPQQDFGLNVSDLRKSFYSPTGARIEVLRGVSFSTNAGEAIAIMGASGAGKSTLLHLLGGLEAPDHGSIVAGGFAIDAARAAALARWRNRRVGLVFQFHHLLPDLTAAENVSLPLRIARANAREAMRRARELLREVGLDSRTSGSVVGHLSGGEQQRVAVCRALITRPALVLADEPTGNLDTTIGDEVARSLVSYARDHRALVIIATHNAALAEICDRTLVLRDGRLVQA
ncbi:MAG TPA: ABC transporter ATP-binding protein [Pyrinomonadaceae bacterium]|nr:ABC transporter ATP-binding protein [Pyrinomonadaceae bacterium]